MFSHRGSKDCQERNSNLCQENSVIQPLLTDLYQITMAYSYWKSGKTDDVASFDLFFRKNPFKGEFTIFAGLSDCLGLLQNFHYSDSDIAYLRTVLPSSVEDEFFAYLQTLTPKDVTVHALPEGSVCFPRIPLMRISGPLIVVQLLETTFLTLVNFASLISTNAARFRIAAGENITLLEFGLRRAQGPDGGLSASRYAYIGGFDGTSNVLAGKLYGIPVKGTHAHAYVTSFTSLEELITRTLKKKEEEVTTDETKEEEGQEKMENIPEAEEGGEEIIEGAESEANEKEEGTGEGEKEGEEVEEKTAEEGEEDFVDKCVKWREQLGSDLNIMASEAHEGELAAFISYALAFPNTFVALIDTYDVARSGILNFCSVALALNDHGYRALGIRIDSGDLAYLSRIVKEAFDIVAEKYELDWFKELIITASNDINEETILSLNDQGHKITCFGIGTHLVTCQRQPALGGVFKLVEVNGRPKIKLSQDVQKITMPGRKEVFRLYSDDGHAIIDLLQMPDEDPPQVGHRVLCRHPFEESKRAYVIPHKVDRLYQLVWSNGQIVVDMPNLKEIRDNVKASLYSLRRDHKRSLNPTPFKVGVTDRLYHFIHDLWLENAPIGELS